MIENITGQNQQEAIAFLSKYDETSVFLLGNLYEHGPKLGSHPHSGNFKLIREEGDITCVFCLTHRGNLLIQSKFVESIFPLIITSCEQEPIAIQGIIGEWKVAERFWQILKDKQIITKETFFSKEINYVLSLESWDGSPTKEARLLKKEDFEIWHALRCDYLEEQQLPHDLSDQEMYQLFLEKCAKGIIWGLFIDSQLISMAELNALTDTLATVGGVYTKPSWRRKGFGKALMRQLIYDCKHKLLLHKLMIFTGEESNFPAQKLYESLGCRHVGYMALLFGK